MLTRRLRRFLQRKPGRHIILLFALTILLPGLFLAAFSLRVLEQDRQLAFRDIEVRLELVSREAADLLDGELWSLAGAMDGAGRAGVITPAAMPDWIREAAAVPGQVAIAIPNVAVWPAHGVAYLPWESTAADHVANPADAASLRAQRLNDHAQAERRRGRSPQATQLFAELVSMGPFARVGFVPADLVGRFGLCEMATVIEQAARCGAELHRELTNGSWLLEKPRYLWYRQRAEVWMGAGHMRTESDRLIERRRIALAEALASDADGHQDDVAVVRVNAAPDGTGSAVLAAMRRDWIEREWWPHVAGRRRHDGFDVRLSASKLPLTSAPSGGNQRRTTWHTVGDQKWRLDVAVRDLQTLLAPSSRRRTVNVAMLAGTATLLVFGTYFTSRLVRRELEIARMKSDFVSAVSHEFRSPLTGIRQLSEMLARGRVPSEARRQEYYERIAGESDRLSRVVDNILDFSRMEYSRRPYRFEPIEMAPWLRDVSARIERTLKGGSHRIVSTIPDLAPICGDRDALTTAIDNLVDNAVKYSPEADTIWLTAENRGTSVAIHVRDRGCGIDPGDRTHLFERFYRGGSELTRATRGTGIGLSLVDHIVRAHNGRVDVESGAGHGSTFTIVLPAASRPGDSGSHGT